MTRTVLTVFFLLTAACVDGPAQGELDPNRAPLGKADNYGSCENSDCDGPSDDGNCWCDEECIIFGDCCTDRAEICEAPVSKICGGFLGQLCDEDEYCHFEQDAGCGFADASGVCRAKPEVCIELFAPVCGCNGQTFGNSCKAAAAGTAVKHDGSCDAPAPDCQPVLCELFCENGFATGDDGCEICSCAE